MTLTLILTLSLTKKSLVGGWWSVGCWWAKPLQTLALGLVLTLTLKFGLDRDNTLYPYYVIVHVGFISPSDSTFGPRDHAPFYVLRSMFEFK